MCGIIAVFAQATAAAAAPPAGASGATAAELCEGLGLLQHRGQVRLAAV